MTVTVTPPPASATTAPVPAGRPPRRTGTLRSTGTAYLLVVPALLVLGVVAAWPLVKIVTLSLQEQQGGKYALFHGGGTPFAGLDNYRQVLTDHTFWAVTGRTVTFTAVNVVLSIVIGLAMAVLLNRVSRWARLVLVGVLLFVWAIPATVATQVFYWLFNSKYGVVNYLLDLVPGVHAQHHDWFADPHEGLAVVTLVVVWGAVPLLAISLHAGISQIPRELVEAARVDGAGPWQVFRSITLPALRGLLVILLTLSVIWDFGVFHQIWFMRDGHPEQGYQTLGIYMYATGIGSSHYNTGATIAVLMMLALAGVMVFYIRLLLRIGDES
jgi:N,N'-diacetylchitobiose transport system permease protein